MAKPDASLDQSSEEHMDKVSEQAQAAYGRSRTLEPSGDAEHDRLTHEALNLDALAPERNQVFADADAEALDDEEHSD